MSSSGRHNIKIMFRTILGSDGESGKFSQKHRNQQTITSDIYRGHVKFIHSKKATNFCESFAYHVCTALMLVA